MFRFVGSIGGSMATSAFDTCTAQVKGQLRSIVAFSFAANMLMLVSSIYMLQVFDRVLSSGSVDTLIWLTVAALTGMVAYGFLEHARRRLLARVGSWLEVELSRPVIDRGIDARLAGMRSEASSGDVADLKAFISGEAILAFLDAPWMPIFIAIIWFMHPALGVLALSGAIVLFGLAVLNEVMTRTKAARAAGEARALQNAAQQMIDHAEVVRSLGMVKNMLLRWGERQRLAHAAAHATADVTEVISNITRAVRMALQVLILGIGAFLVLKGELTAGGMIAASIILGRALSPVERALGAWRSWVAARKARQNLAALFTAVPERKEMMALPVPKGRLTLEALRYAPAESIEPILQRLDLEIEPGTTCGLIGPSGSGKSTLCRLIVGAWRPSYGHVRLDGADVTSWNADALGQHIGYLPQEIELFPGTIAENIARMGNVDPEAVSSAARLADVHEMILRLPMGYETDVGIHGHKISGGQRQRIGLARALYGDPVLVILDEPNANLDSAGEQALLRALTELKRLNKTILIVAHQPSALRTADTIVVLRDGLIHASGPRDEVLKQLAVFQQRPAPNVATQSPAVALGGSAVGEL